MDAVKKKSQLCGINAVIFDFDGTLAALNIDFSLMREQVFNLIKRHRIREETIQEKYLLEIIDEVYQILWKKILHAEAFIKSLIVFFRSRNESSEEGADWEQRYLKV
jgi:phosphoglycolate phosphatase-like HAD superfamily hydrolase